MEVSVFHFDRRIFVILIFFVRTRFRRSSLKVFSFFCRRWRMGYPKCKLRCQAQRSPDRTDVARPVAIIKIDWGTTEMRRKRNSNTVRHMWSNFSSLFHCACWLWWPLLAQSISTRPRECTCEFCSLNDTAYAPAAHGLYLNDNFSECTLHFMRTALTRVPKSGRRSPTRWFSWALLCLWLWYLSFSTNTDFTKSYMVG